MDAEDKYNSMLRMIEARLNPESNTVLIVDDEMGIRRFVARGIRKLDPNIVMYEASNGKEAIDTLAKIRKTHSKEPVMIVTDLNMPVMDGWEFIEHLRKEYEDAGQESGIPIIVLSSTSGEKGTLFKKSVHGDKSGYHPLVSIAKEVCTDPSRYDASGDTGLMAWLKQFTKYT